ncbi:hypothetical protein C7S20_15050 [Christiangramia fulva]|uniref:SH3b domain-containing protein n=1 Tax=Christiangramia fulva TaxID=2126553 RepID=A0A2R3Z852_9FLAO|nr:hypothetical protein [Christiangramia fulva]AVR46473.1 hypothetical protein C7S20_15050 [Christiangramia fulva]
MKYYLFIIFSLFLGFANSQEINYTEQDPLPREPESLSLTSFPDDIYFIAKKDFHLKSTPNNFGRKLEMILKGTKIKPLDSIGAFYLLCQKGNCGYAHKNFLQYSEKVVRNKNKK